MLGVHFHGATVLWTTYYGCSEWIADVYCVNPQSECCQGKCHIVKVERDSGADGQSQLLPEAPRILLAPLQDCIIDLNNTPQISDMDWRPNTPSSRSGFLRLPDHPPRV